MLQLTNDGLTLVDHLARAQKQKRDNGQWRNIKGQTQSVFALDGDEWGVIHCLPLHLPSLTMAAPRLSTMMINPTPTIYIS